MPRDGLSIKRGVRPGGEVWNKRLLIPYAPRQVFADFHTTGRRWAVIVAHRRAGKTVAAVNKLIKAAIANPLADGRYAYIAPWPSQGNRLGLPEEIQPAAVGGTTE
jgi:hypothetical protein